MEFWIAKDGDNSLWLFNSKPKKNIKEKAWYPTDRVTILWAEHFPEVTFENSPKKVEIKLIEE